MPTFQKTVIYFGILIIIAVVVGSYLLREVSESFVDVKEVKTYADCEDAGGVTSELYPRNCRTISGRIFIEPPRDAKKTIDQDDILYPPKCVIRGCNNEYCMDEDSLLTDNSVCRAQPERVCYEKAKCAVQEDGLCGWEETNSFLDCLVQKKSLRRLSAPQVGPDCEEWFDGCTVCDAQKVNKDSLCPGSRCSEKLVQNAVCRK